jgi:hypothetical protein
LPEEEKAPIVDYERGETATQKADRHWGELLQEMRVMETGTQILGGFLLTLPFQQGFRPLMTSSARSIWYSSSWPRP